MKSKIEIGSDAPKQAGVQGCSVPSNRTVAILYLIVAASILGVAGCGTGTPQKQNRDFFTSGSREADERASQRMAKAEQLTGSGEGAGEKGVKKASTEKAAGGGSSEGGTNKA